MLLMTYLLGNNRKGELLPGDDIPYASAEVVSPDQVATVTMIDYGTDSLTKILQALKKKKYIEVRLSDDVYRVDEFSFIDALSKAIPGII